MMMEERQRQSDADQNACDRRRENRERFATFLPDDLFAMGVENMRAFAPPPIKENDPSRLAAIADELRTEGKVHVNTRPQRHE